MDNPQEHLTRSSKRLTGLEVRQCNNFSIELYIHWSNGTGAMHKFYLGDTADGVATGLVKLSTSIFQRCVKDAQQ